MFSSQLKYLKILKELDYKIKKYITKKEKSLIIPLKITITKIFRSIPPSFVFLYRHIFCFYKMRIILHLVLYLT